MKNSKEQWVDLVDHYLARFINTNYHPMELMMTVNQIVQGMNFEGFRVYHGSDPNLTFSGLTFNESGNLCLVWEAGNRQVLNEWIVKGIDYRKKKMYSDYGFEIIGGRL